MIGGRVSLVVLRPGEPNRWGESTPVRVRIPGRFTVAPGTSTEAGEWSNAVTDAVTLYGPFDVDVRPSDEVEVEGLVDPDGTPYRWEVEGEPSRWRSPFTGSRRGSSIVLRRVRG